MPRPPVRPTPHTIDGPSRHLPGSPSRQTIDGSPRHRLGGLLGGPSRRTRSRRAPGRLVPVLVAVPLLLAGCGGGPPEVGFTAGETSVTARPAQYCDIQLTECDDDATAPVELAVAPGTPLRVTVPEPVSEAPWHVVFSYRTPAGEQVDERSPVFPPGERQEYVLELPDPQARLLTAEVQQFGPPPQANAETGEIEFPVRGSWVLNVAS